MRILCSEQSKSRVNMLGNNLLQTVGETSVWTKLLNVFIYQNHYVLFFFPSPQIGNIAVFRASCYIEVAYVLCQQALSECEEKGTKLNLVSPCVVLISPFMSWTDCLTYSRPLIVTLYCYFILWQFPKPLIQGLSAASQSTPFFLEKWHAFVQLFRIVCGALQILSLRFSVNSHRHRPFF